MLAQINKPLAVVSACNQGLFRREVTSGTCISTTRDPATKGINHWKGWFIVRGVNPFKEMRESSAYPPMDGYEYMKHILILYMYTVKPML